MPEQGCEVVTRVPALDVAEGRTLARRARDWAEMDPARAGVASMLLKWSSTGPSALPAAAWGAACTSVPRNSKVSCLQGTALLGCCSARATATQRRQLCAEMTVQGPT